jgi:hypothetical protein
MIFSTHRFGNLTRYADLILCVSGISLSTHLRIYRPYCRYMNDSAIVEAGTHEELLKHEGSDYGRLWRMQAEAFL